MVLQRINSKVFPRPDLVMANLEQLLHVFEQDGAGLSMPRLYRTRDGGCCVRDEHGDYWRLLSFIDNSVTLQTLSTASQAAEVGRALAAFHQRAAALNEATLYDTLPGFHVTPDYLAAYDRVAGDAADPVEHYCRDIIERGRPLAPLLQQSQAQGHVRRRVTHGDPKLNNFLFNRDADRVVSLIDLDTVKPGMLHHDIGDCIRSCCNRSEEGADEAEFDPGYCRELLGAWLAGAGSLLGGDERRLVFEAILLLPWELGLRFYTDHLQGDRYFRVEYRGQNLRRARLQFQLHEQIAGMERDIRRWIETA